MLILFVISAGDETTTLGSEEKGYALDEEPDFRSQGNAKHVLRSEHFILAPIPWSLINII